MKIKLNIKLFILVISTLFINVAHVLSSETFNNNLLKTELHKSAIGGVRVVLFTGKPYTDSVKVNKKSDTEYVILMPETSNSSIGKPSLKWVSDVIKDVEIKTQPYQNNIKGYTKVIIKSTKPVEIATQVQTSVSGFKMSDKEYKELLSQASGKKQELQAKPATKIVDKAHLKNQSKVEQKPLAKNPTVVKVLPTKLASHKDKSQKNIALASKVSSQRSVSKVQVKSETVQPKKQNMEKQVVVTAQQHKNEPANIIQPSKPQEIVVETQKESVNINNSKSKTVVAFVKQRIDWLIKIFGNNLTLALSVALFVFFFLLIIARKMNKSIMKSQKNFSSHLQDNPQTPVDFTENITEEMNWKEKFKACTDSPKAEGDELYSDEFAVEADSCVDFSDEISSGATVSDLDNLFESHDLLQENPKKVDDLFLDEAVISDSSPSLDNFIETEDIFVQEASVDDLFAENENLAGFLDVSDDESSLLVDDELVDTFADIQEVESMDETTQYESEEKVDSDSQIVKSEFKIDENKAIYLVDFEQGTSLVGCIGEEVFVLKQFSSQVNGSINARLSEQSSSSSQYMLKVAGFRGLIEVTSDSMNLLIEL